MTDKLMYISNDDTQNYPSVEYNQWLKRLYTKLNEPTNQNIMKVPKVIETTNGKSKDILWKLPIKLSNKSGRNTLEMVTIKYKNFWLYF